MKNNKIMLTIPSLKAQGGVAQFYNAILPHMPDTIDPIEIGGFLKAGGFLHPLLDQFRFRSAIKKIKPTLIHLNPSLGLKSFIRDGLFAWQANQMGYPFVVFWRGWDKDFETIVEQKYSRFFKHTFGHASGFIVLATEFERKLRDWGVKCPIYHETTSVDENLLQGFNKQKKWLNPTQINPVKILFLARLERAKGVFETVQAIKILLDKKLSVQLTIAGDGDIRHELEIYAKERGLTSQKVVFTGDIRGGDKVQAFAEHHIYCFPTFYGEGLPNSVLEAMAFGMPVVTRPVGGLADIFEDGKMGRLVQGKSPDEIANCLESLILDKQKLAEIGLYNARYAKEYFMASVVAKRLLKIYAEVIEKGK